MMNCITINAAVSINEDAQFIVTITAGAEPVSLVMTRKESARLAVDLLQKRCQELGGRNGLSLRKGLNKVIKYVLPKEKEHADND